MFNIFSKKQKSTKANTKIASGLTKTRDSLSDRFAKIFLGRSKVDQGVLDDIEELLISADVGVSSTAKIIEELKKELNQHGNLSKDESSKVIKKKMVDLIKAPKNKVFTKTDSPKVLLIVGVNGVGKTTSFSKIIKYASDKKQSVLVAAGDTYRAAATAQLKTWCDRLNVPLVAQQDGADPAAVVYDALSSAKAKKMDVLIADTAGRLHTQDNLMSELEKVKRVLKKLDETAPHETLMVIDATTGQTAFSQAAVFSKVLGIDGIILTKLDGTAKGGIIFTIQDKLGIPVKYVGVGESVEDFSEFNAKEFVNALFE
jgi:fused signal recognition particle receptor